MRILLILLLALLPLTALAQDEADDDRGFLQGLIEDGLSDTSREVRLVNFQGALSRRATVDEITVADEDGIWLTLTDVAIGWNRAQLLNRAIDIEELSAARIEISRMPVRENSPPSPEAQGFALPDLPVSVKIRGISAREIVLGEPVLGEPVIATLTGDITLVDDIGTADLRMERIDDKTGRFVLDTSFDGTTRQLALMLQVEEGESGIVAGLLNLPDRPALRLSVAGDAPLDAFNADIALATDEQDRLTGAVALSTRANDPETAPDRLFDASLSGDVRPLLQPDFRSFFGARATLNIAGTAFADGRLELSAIDINAAEIALTGSLALGSEGWPERFALEGRVGSDAGAPVRLPIGGAATFVQSMLLDINFDAAAGDRWGGRFQLNAFDRPGLGMRVLEVDGGGLILRGEGEPLGRFSADLRYGARGLSFDDPAVAEAIGTNIYGQVDVGRVEGNPLVLRAVTIRGPGVELRGNAILRGPSSGLWTRLSLTARADDFSRFARLSGLDLAGAGEISLDGDIAPLDGTADLSVRARTEGLSVGIAPLDALLQSDGRLSFALSRDETGSRLRNLSLVNDEVTARANVFLSSGGTEAALTAGLRDLGILTPQLSGPGTLSAKLSQDALGTLDLNATLRAPQASATAVVTANPTGESHYVAEGQLDANFEALGPYSALFGRDVTGAASGIATGRLETATGAFTGTVEATTRDLSPGPDALASVLAGTGRIALRARRDPGGRLRLDGIEADFPNLTASGSVFSDTTTRAELDLRLADIGLLAPDFSGPVTARVAAEQDAAGWQVDASAEGPAGTAARAAGRIGTSGELSLGIDGSGPLALANAFIAPQQLSGLARLNLSVNGPANLSSVSGTVTISDGRLTAPQLRQTIEAIDGIVRLSAGTAQLDIAGAGPDGGLVTVRGPVALTPPFGSALRIGLDALPYSDPALYETTVSGTVAIDGGLANGAAVTGTLALGPVEMRVPSSTIGALGALPQVTHVGAPPQVRATLSRIEMVSGRPAGQPPAAGTAWPLNLTINAPSRIFIRGRGLDAELGGSLQLTGTTAAIVPIGRFDLIRGRLDLLGQRFEFSEGYAQLQGDFQPLLFLQARTEAENGTEIRIVIDGPVTSPEVRFESSPELPQDEVLSQLIFGRDLSSISPLQAVQLASAIGTLSGRGGGVLDDLRKGLNVDDFDITSDDDGTVAVRAGKYLSENVYTDVTIGADGMSEINLNLDITTDLSARGSVATDGETSVGIFYERDY